MFTPMVKNIIILSLIFLPMQTFAAPTGYLIDSLPQYPQPKIEVPPFKNSQGDLTIKHTANPTMLQLNEAQNAANENLNNKSFLPITIPIQEDVLKQKRSTRQNPPVSSQNPPVAVQNPPVAVQNPPVAVQNEVTTQDAIRDAAAKILSGRNASPLSLIDYMLKSNQDSQNNLMGDDDSFLPIDTIHPTSTLPMGIMPQYPTSTLPMGIMPQYPTSILPMGIMPQYPTNTLPMGIMPSPPLTTQPPKIALPRGTSPNNKSDGVLIPHAKIAQNLDFMKGCWVGFRPEYLTKRMVTERFCFDANGIGKRYIIDAKFSLTCVGTAEAQINEDSFLNINSEIMHCSPSKEKWGGSKMQCKNEVDKTFCTLFFTDINGARQSNEVLFIRE